MHLKANIIWSRRGQLRMTGLRFCLNPWRSTAGLLYSKAAMQACAPVFQNPLRRLASRRPRWACCTGLLPSWAILPMKADVSLPWLSIWLDVQYACFLFSVLPCRYAISYSSICRLDVVPTITLAKYPAPVDLLPHLKICFGDAPGGGRHCVCLFRQKENPHIKKGRQMTLPCLFLCAIFNNCS